VGYKGTVGSREGWAPKEFVSSRNQDKSEIKQQNIFDFMDEEDLVRIEIVLTIFRESILQGVQLQLTLTLTLILDNGRGIS